MTDLSSSYDRARDPTHFNYLYGLIELIKATQNLIVELIWLWGFVKLCTFTLQVSYNFIDIFREMKYMTQCIFLLFIFWTDWVKPFSCAQVQHKVVLFLIFGLPRHMDATQIFLSGLEILWTSDMIQLFMLFVIFTGIDLIKFCFIVVEVKIH
jgi:hypothetical protein